MIIDPELLRKDLDIYLGIYDFKNCNCIVNFVAYFVGRLLAA